MDILNNKTLPGQCYGVLLEDKSLILIKKGESGYYPLTRMHPEDLMKSQGFKTMDELADSLNADEGTTKAQRKAMEWGSQFGWEGWLSRPSSYDEDGKIRREAAPVITPKKEMTDEEYWRLSARERQELHEKEHAKWLKERLTDEA